MIRPTDERIDEVIERAKKDFCDSFGLSVVVIERRDLATMINCLRVVKATTEPGRETTLSGDNCTVKGREDD